MFVYLVEFSEYDDQYVVGVYSTREKAEKAIVKDSKREHKCKDNYIITRTKIDEGIYESKNESSTNDNDWIFEPTNGFSRGW